MYFLEKLCMLKIQNCVLSWKIMYVENTELCTLNVQNCVYSLILVYFEHTVIEFCIFFKKL